MENQTTLLEKLENNRRNLPDRRKNQLKSIICSLHMGRRKGPQRHAEKNRPYYTDIYERWVIIVTGAISVLSISDAFFTLKILEKGGEEINPVMEALLSINDTAFLAGKFTLTVVCLFFALIHINFNVLHLFPMRGVLCTILVFYSSLIGYELFLLSL